MNEYLERKVSLLKGNTLKDSLYASIRAKKTKTKSRFSKG